MERIKTRHRPKQDSAGDVYMPEMGIYTSLESLVTCYLVVNTLVKRVMSKYRLKHFLCYSNQRLCYTFSHLHSLNISSERACNFVIFYSEIL